MRRGRNRDAEDRPASRCAAWWISASLLVSACTPPPCGQEPLDGEERTCVVDTVWSLAAEHYPFFELKNIDWGAARAEVSAQALAAPDDLAFQHAIAGLVSRLQDGHSGVYSPAGDWGDSVTSLSIATIDRRFFVARVEPGSDAASQGILPGDEVVAVDGEPAEQRLARAGPFLFGALEAFRLWSFTRSYLTAGATSSAMVLVRDASGADRTVSLKRGSRSGSDESAPRMRELPGGFGYIRVDRFFLQEDLWRFDAAVTRLANARGVVIDLRGNPGGTTTLSYPMASRFFDRPTGPIVRFHKESTREVGLTPRGAIYSGPVAILIDEAVYSTANNFVSLFQFTRRGILVGRTTGGGTGIPEVRQQLTTQMTFQVSNFYTELVDGTQTELTGVRPDIEVPMSLEDLRMGLYAAPGEPAHDRDLATALDALGRGDP